VVCDTTLPHKNAELSIRLASRSKAAAVEVWGKSSGQADTDRVKWKGFSADKSRIYDDIDVLVHLSRLECQPLVVLEAISAGIPCVLAPIPAYAHLQGLKGIYLVDLEDEDAIVNAVNDALDCDDFVRDGLADFWQRHHSPNAVCEQWKLYLAELAAMKDLERNALVSARQ
jgi:glycosyltransferase involved in cell wall biosynthesis